MQEKINELNALLPSVPFVAEQIGFGLKFAQESCKDDEEQLGKVLDWAISLTKSANKHSNTNFYAYRPILCALLSVVEDEKVLEVFKTETNSVLVTLSQIREFIQIFNESAKKASIALAKAIMADDKDFCILAMSFLNLQVDETNKINLLKTAFISADLRINGFEMTGALYELYNNLLIALNKVTY